MTELQDLRRRVVDLEREIGEAADVIAALTGGERVADTATPILLHDARRKLRESEERFRALFATAATGIAVAAPEGQYVQANPAYCRLVGYTEDELRVLDFAAFTHPEDLQLNVKLRNELPPPRPPPLQTPARGPMPTPPYVHRAPPPLPRRILVTYGDRTRTVEGATFVIGRAKASGLAIKDPNISRHAMIELHGGVHYLVDAGSTNGTFVNGERIARRALADGDVVTICDHVIRISVAQCR